MPMISRPLVSYGFGEDAMVRAVEGRFAGPLAGGASVATVRQQFAASPEAHDRVNALYHQVLGRDVDVGRGDGAAAA